MNGTMWLSALSLLALAVSAVALVISSRKAPSQHAVALQKTAAEVVSKWTAECALMEATRDRWTGEFAGIADRCDEILDRTESKRRRIAATESRTGNGAAQQPDGEPWAGMSRNEIIDAGRRMVRGS